MFTRKAYWRKDKTCENGKFLARPDLTQKFLFSPRQLSNAGVWKLAYAKCIKLGSEGWVPKVKPS